MPTMKQMLKELVGVPIELDGSTYPNDYAEDLSIDRSNLDAEFVEHAERYAYYATLAEMAEDRHARKREELDTLTSRLDHEIREGAKAIQLQDPKFKMTEAMVAHDIVIDPRYQAMMKEVQEARHLAKVLKNAPLAFAHRRDMLIELGKSFLSAANDPRITMGKHQQVRAMMTGSAQRAAAGAADPDAPPADLLERGAPEPSPEPAPARRRAPKNQ